MSEKDHGEALEVYRACVAEVGASRKRWADAELAWNACADPRRTGRRWPECACGECAAKVTAAEEAVLFVKACVIAAGETAKGAKFADIIAARKPAPPRPEGL